MKNGIQFMTFAIIIDVFSLKAIPASVATDVGTPRLVG